MFSLFRFLSYYFSSDKKLYLSFKNLLGFYPSNLSIYKQCVRHRSASINIKEGADNSNERLEFLGDAVLGAVVAHYLFRKFPFKDEGYLTKVRSRIVSRQNLNSLSRKLGLSNMIDVKREQEQIYKSAAGDALEALIGAIYLDKGYVKAKMFIVDKLISIHLNIDEIIETDKDYKSRLVEWSQRERKAIRYEIAGEKGTGHQKYYIIDLYVDEVNQSSGSANSKKLAEQHAAEKFIFEQGI